MVVFGLGENWIKVESSKDLMEDADVVVTNTSNCNFTVLVVLVFVGTLFDWVCGGIFGGIRIWGPNLTYKSWVRLTSLKESVHFHGSTRVSGLSTHSHMRTFKHCRSLQAQNPQTSVAQKPLWVLEVPDPLGNDSGKLTIWTTTPGSLASILKANRVNRA